MTSQRSTGLEIIIIVQLLSLYSEISSLDYKDLADLDISCPPADTCVGRVLAETLERRSCDCGPSCSRHGTCCIDSPFRDVKLLPTLEECTRVESINRNVFMISKCNPLWSGPERTRELCEGGITSFGDPVSIIPTISRVSGLTYANIFCSMCNNETDVRLWYYQITREEWSGEDTRMCAGMVPRVLEYTNVTGEFAWGYWHEYITDRKKFIPVRVQIEIPIDMKALVSECFVDSVSECAKDWDDGEVKNECESYMAAIEVPLENETGDFTGNRTYRNIHCALCNRVESLGKASCKLLGEQSNNDYPPTSYLHTILSFPNLVPSMECLLHIAGIQPKEYLQQCRTVVCDPGYVINGGKCIPKGIS